MTLFYAFFNINDLNTHYSVNDYFILILIWVFIYIFTSISSLLIYEVCLDYTKKLIRKFFFENLKIKFFKKREKKIISSVLFFFYFFIKLFTFFIKIKINENIYKKFDYSINKWLFLFYYFLIYIVSGIFPILSLIILGCFEKNDKNLEYIEKYENNNNNNDEEIELLIKVNESTVNFFGNIYYKYKRLKEKKKQNEDFDINLTEIKKNFKDNEKINKILY